MALLDEAIEDLAGLAGEILRQLDETVVGEREAHHLHAARAWAAGDRGATTRSLKRVLLRHPRDVWAVHARAHVFEMEGSQQDGIKFLTASAPDWSGSFFAVHNWWHRGLARGDDLRPGRRPRANELVVAANRHLTAPTNRRAAERAGVDLLEAFSAFADDRPDRAIDLLIDIRPRASAVGGSHAQRDIIDLTLIAAAARAGDDALARALVTERAARKPAAEAAARQLVIENGGSADALRW